MCTIISYFFIFITTGICSMDITPETINNYEDIGKPYFHKVEDNQNYTTYVSFDDKYRTVYNKKTHEIFYTNKRDHGSNRFKTEHKIPK